MNSLRGGGGELVEYTTKGEKEEEEGADVPVPVCELLHAVEPRGDEGRRVEGEKLGARVDRV